MCLIHHLWLAVLFVFCLFLSVCVLRTFTIMNSNYFLSIDCIRLPLQAFKFFIKVIVYYVILKQYSFNQNETDFVIIMLHCLTSMSLFRESLSISVNCVSSQFSPNPSNCEHLFKVYSLFLCVLCFRSLHTLLCHLLEWWW